MYKFKTLTLLILFSISTNSFSLSEEDEIPDLKKADICFQIANDKIKLTPEINREQKLLKQKEKKLWLWKQKINKETKAIDVEAGKQLNSLNKEIKSYNKIENNFQLEKNSLNEKIAKLIKNDSVSLQLSCTNTIFSEESIEKICIIDKKYALACSIELKKYELDTN